jgi:LysR family transcriptional regulator, nitrogen assimilation regulatory protein
VNSKQLEIFLKVAETGNLSLAARAAGRLQSVLSRQIRELEADLGTSLFRRNGRGLALTEAGRRLYDRASHIMGEMGEAEREVRNLGRARVTQATIAMPTTMGRMIIKPLVRAIFEELPGIRLRIREGTSGPILDWISTRRVDVAILYNTMSTPANATETICEETMYLVGRASDTRLPSVTDVAALQDVPLILPGPTEALRILCEMAAARLGVRLNVVIEADTFTAIRQMIEAGYGYSILPFPAVQPEVEEGRYQVSRLQNPGVTRNLVVTTCGDRVPAAGLSCLVRLIKSTVRAAVQPEAPAQSSASVPRDRPTIGSKGALGQQSGRPTAHS